MPAALEAVLTWLGVAVGLALVWWVLWRTAIGGRVREWAAALTSVHVRWRLSTLGDYHQAVLRRDRYVPLPFRHGDNHPVEIIDAYVEQDLGPDHKPFRGRLDLSARKPLRYVITGDQGAGKTVLLRSLLHSWAKDFPIKSLRVPVRLPLEQLAVRANRPETALRDTIVAYFEAHGISAPRRFVNHALANGRLSILLDALDEVPQEAHEAVEDIVRRAVARYRGCHFVITCREAVYKGAFDDVGFARLRLCDLDDQQIATFLNRWAARPGGDTPRVDALVAQLTANPRLYELAKNPLLLTYLAHLYGRPESAESLPYSRSAFYEHLVGQLLDDADRPTLDAKLLVLKRFAIENMDLSSGRVMPRAYLIRTIMDTVGGVSEGSADRLLRTIAERSGLLRRVETGGYAFPHLTIQEYFAALELGDNESGVIAKLDESWGPWTEVVKLWCGTTELNALTVWKRVCEISLALGFACLAEVPEDNPMFESEGLKEVTQILANAIREADSTLMHGHELELLASHPVVGEIVTNQAALELHDSTERGRPDGVHADAMAQILDALPRETVILRLIELARIDPAAREVLGGMEPSFIVNIVEGKAASGDLDAALELLDFNVEAASASRFVGMLALLTSHWDTVWGPPERGSMAENLQARMAWHVLARLSNGDDEEALNRSWSLSAHQGSNAWRPFEGGSDANIAYFVGLAAELAGRRRDLMPPTLRRIDPRAAMLLLADQLGPGDVAGFAERDESQSISDWLRQRLLDSVHLPIELVDVLLNSVSTPILVNFVQLDPTDPSLIMSLFWTDIDGLFAEDGIETPEHLHHLKSVALNELEVLRESGVSPYSRPRP